VEPPISVATSECCDAHQRLLATVAGLDDATARQPSRLADWAVGHVLTHLARNADGHVRRLEGALRGEEVPRYGGGMDQRNREIEHGAYRPASQLVDDLANSAWRLEETWDRCERAGWPHADLLASDHWPTTGSPLRRLREVEVHHVDLGLGYEPTDWPRVYVDWELPLALKKVPQRLADPGDAQRLLAWLTGRADALTTRLNAWM
jgi:maleylpyruvate isomerase